MLSFINAQELNQLWSLKHSKNTPPPQSRIKGKIGAFIALKIKSKIITLGTRLILTVNGGPKAPCLDDHNKSSPQQIKKRNSPFKFSDLNMIPNFSKKKILGLTYTSRKMAYFVAVQNGNAL